MKLLFVYNADSGLFNTLTDIAHKLLSPQTYQCQLCAITHSAFTERTEWRNFIDGLGVACEFLHRDEFLRQYPLDKTPLPAIFQEENGELTLRIDREQINTANSVDELKHLLEAAALKERDNKKA